MYTEIEGEQGCCTENCQRTELNFQYWECRLPVKEGGTIAEKRAMSQVYYAIDHGINYVESGWIYHMGESKPFLGGALVDGYRQKIKLATKLPSWLVKSREDMDYFLNSQLERLKTDHIDYYLIHDIAGEMWDKLEALDVIDFLDRAKSDGRIINVGFSFHGLIEDFKRIVDSYPWIFCQIQYNFMDEKIRQELRDLNIQLQRTWVWLSWNPCLEAISPVQYLLQKIWNEAAVRTPAEWALRWIGNTQKSQSYFQV